MAAKIELLSILADGRFHSGEALGRAIGVSRTMIWKHMQTLQTLGIECYSVSGKGYRLATAVELLEQHLIEAAMDEVSRSWLTAIELHPEIHSTNRHLLEQLGSLSSGHACFAERQTAGRGRRGREWVSPFARNIYLSLYWRFEMSPALLSGLGLAIGVALIRALRQLGINDAELKWPNDVLWQGRKLAGILLEMSGESGGPYHVVIGVGMNVNMADDGVAIDQPWVALNDIALTPLSRNRVAGVVLHHLLLSIQQFQTGCLESFIPEWLEADAYVGQSVVIMHGDKVVMGQAQGIDPSGAIIVEVDGVARRFHSGEVSLRPAV
ncbi:MAG: bifunctional biotin--[acetyl-CoA-carboxylase] ligase/biotin operon repressor BirA [Pseudomonadota bacterium]|nr:bifunctional biotin--[acetyl-CoA-carboxylase] ligase/biotin operon repressor BirA [Pseudomonadota bacterium]